MYEGLFYGSLLICLACLGIGLLSGNGGDIGLSITGLIVLICIGVKACKNGDEFYKMRYETLKKWCPGESEAWYKKVIAQNQDGLYVQRAAENKRWDDVRNEHPTWSFNQIKEYIHNEDEKNRRFVNQHK